MRNREKQAIAAALTTAMAFSFTTPALAGDTLPYLGDSAKGENQPYQHGYRGEDFLNWNPETDKYSEYLRAKVPLQERNEAFSETQANKNLSPNTEFFALAGDYGNAFFDSYPYTNEFSQYLFNFWQYTDYYGSWHGMPTQEVPESMYQSERGVTDAWKSRKFEFGLVNLPNPAYTNAAHKNGVMSIGCIFLPRTGLKHTVLLTKDENGNFPYAKKLVEICKYYGFDGWFINQEEDIPQSDIELYKEFMKQMRDDGLYVQWYDSVTDTDGKIDYQNEFNSLDSGFVSDGKTQYASSIFLNYWWNKDMLANSAEHAQSLNINPLKTVFVGVEAGKDGWNQKYDLRWNLGSDGQPLNSIASLGTDFVHHGLDADLGTGDSDNTSMRREKDEFQWMAFERERRWWSGPFEDPTLASSTADPSTYPQAPEIGISGDKSQNFDGVAAYITERSVIKGDTFVTDFNTGHGLEYKINGQTSNDHEWSNINVQDILPTWQWWIDSANDSKLKVDFDYGEKYKKNYDNGAQDVLGKSGSFDFNLVGGYNGGSSLVVYGDINAENFLHLYKTDLNVKNNSKVNITFKKTSNDDVKMQLGVIFKDSPETVTKIDLSPVSSSSDWSTCQADLSKYAGKEIEAFGLVFDGNAKDYQINIGEIAYTSGSSVKPATPTGLKIDSVFDTGEMYISWDLADYDKVKQYNVYANINGKDVYMGGIYDNVFYIKDLYDAKGVVTIKVTAVSADKTESEPAIATFDLSKAVSKLSVDENANKVTVSWDPASGFSGETTLELSEIYTDDKNAPTYKTVAKSGETSSTIELPKQDKDFSYYSLKITPKNGETITYNGRLDDTYCSAYEPSLDHGIDGYRLAVPIQQDWYKMIVSDSNGETKTLVRYSDEMPYVKSGDTYTVTLEDYDGNKSEPVSFKVNDKSVSIVNEIDGASIISGDCTISATSTTGSAMSVTATKTDSGYNIKLEKTSGNSDKNPVKLALLTDKTGMGTVAVVTDANGNKQTVKSSYLSNGYLIVTVDSDCTISIEDNSKKFSDVASDKWYANSVDFVTSRELFSGTSNTAFSPSNAMNRAMLTTVLYRLAGEPSTEKTTQFTDVKDNQYYADAVAWASKNSIVTGTSKDKFSPNNSITREQIATILYRYSGSPESKQTLDSFTDASSVSSYATNAVKWAVEKGILSGKGNGKLDPKATATRAEVATMIMRFVTL